jgi:pimeloyl-ACP methyl ester carboxylesterase
VADYAPFPLETDAAARGFETTVLARPAGSIVARHLPVRRSTRGTLFLHGAAGSWTTWTPLLEAARATGTDLGEVVLLDLPGWGGAAATGALDIDGICAFVEELALQLGYEEWDLVGHSMGGLAALHLAATRPGRVRSVRMISATGSAIIEAVNRPWRSLTVIPGFVTFRAAMITLAHVDRPARAVVRFLGRTSLLRAFVTPLFRHTARIDRTVLTALGTELRPRLFVAATAAVRGYRVPRVDCPVLATRGDRDVFAAPSDYPEATVIADCGHFGNIEHPREVLAALYPRRSP